MKKYPLIHDDARNMLSHKEVADELFDLVLTDPPYSDMMAKERTGQRKKLYNDSAPKPYTDSRADLGNIPIDEFLVELRKIMEIAFSRLKNKGYMVVFCKDFQPQAGQPNGKHLLMLAIFGEKSQF